MNSFSGSPVPSSFFRVINWEERDSIGLYGSSEEDS